MNRLARQLALLLLGALLLSSCSMLTAQGRSERAYARYVAKCSKSRIKQQRKLTRQHFRIPILEPSEPVITTGVSGPESVTSSGEGGGF